MFRRGGLVLASLFPPKYQVLRCFPCEGVKNNKSSLIFFTLCTPITLGGVNGVRLLHSVSSKVLKFWQSVILTRRNGYYG